MWSNFKYSVLHVVHCPSVIQICPPPHSSCNTFLSSWVQTFTMFCMLYVFFWVIPRHLNFICRCFATLFLFHLHRQVGVESPTSTCLWRWNRQSVPKRRHIKFRCRGITQKKTYDFSVLFHFSLLQSLIYKAAIRIHWGASRQVGHLPCAMLSLMKRGSLYFLQYRQAHIK